MNSRGVLRVDPASLAVETLGQKLRLAIVHTDALLTARVLQRTATLVSGLNAEIRLIAVQPVPLAGDFASAAVAHAHLVRQLSELSGPCPFEVTSQVVMTCDWEAGFRVALGHESVILVGTIRQLWRTPEERLARILANDGHQVLLLHVDQR